MPGAEIDFEAEGLLDGCDAATLPDRIALLDQLFGDGASLEEVKLAVADDRLFMLPIERALAGAARYTPREIAERSGLPPEFFIEMRHALGTARPDPDDRSFSDHDLDGVACGTAVNRSGDWYGPTVNLASRMTAVAEPDSIVADASARVALGPGYATEPVGTRSLKGIADPVSIFAVRRADE